MHIQTIFIAAANLPVLDTELNKTLRQIPGERVINIQFTAMTLTPEMAAGGYNTPYAVMITFKALQ